MTIIKKAEVERGVEALKAAFRVSKDAELCALFGRGPDTLKNWRRQAGVQRRTLEAFLAGNPYPELRLDVNDVFCLAPAVPIKLAVERRFAMARTALSSSDLYSFLDREVREDRGKAMTKFRIRLVAQNGASSDVNVPSGTLVEPLNTAPSLEIRLRYNADPHAADHPYVRDLRVLVGDPRSNTSANPLENKPVYTFSAMRRDRSGVTIVVDESSYFSMLAHHDSLQYELLSAIGERKELGHLPERATFRSLLDRTHAAISASALLAYRDFDGDVKIILMQRGAGPAVNQHQLHVTPSGMFQPEYDDHVAECSLQHTLIREFGEELFGYEEADRLAGLRWRNRLHVYSSWKASRELYRLLSDDRAGLWYTGLVHSLANQRPEVCALIFIEDPAWAPKWRPLMLKTFEDAKPEELSEKMRRAKTTFSLKELDRSFTDLVGVEPREPGAPEKVAARWVPVGLASFWLGIAKLRELLDPRVPREKSHFVIDPEVEALFAREK